MLHNERIELCGVCQNRGYSSKLGVICQLTERRAEFEDDCESFTEDTKAIATLVREEEDRVISTIQPNPKVAEALHDVNYAAVFGVVLMIVAVLWLGIGIFSYNRIYFYPIGICGIGLLLVIAGILHRRKQREGSELLDEEF